MKSFSQNKRKELKTENLVDICDVEIAYDVSQKLTTYHLFEMIP